MASVCERCPTEDLFSHSKNVAQQLALKGCASNCRCDRLQLQLASNMAQSNHGFQMEAIPRPLEAIERLDQHSVVEETSFLGVQHSDMAIAALRLPAFFDTRYIATLLLGYSAIHEDCFNTAGHPLSVVLFPPSSRFSQPKT